MGAAETLANGFVRWYRGASPRTRALAMRGPQRRILLAQIFKGMERQFDREKGAGVRSVIRWEISGPPGRDPDRWQLVVEDGLCRAGRRLDRDADLTIKADGERFLEIVTAPAQGPGMYMTGKIKIEGDVMRAAQLTSLFRLPAALS